MGYGTPRGSCLGPLLFLIFCNDLYKNLEFLECIQFADDTTLYFGHKNKNFVLCCVEHDLEIGSDWFKANKLTLNVNKTIFMLFHPKGKRTVEHLKFEDKTITSSHETKFLGIWLNDNLSWEAHIRQLVIKLKRNMILLKRSKNFLTTTSLVPIYYGHVHSHLKYGILLWGSMLTKSQLNRLQKLQDSAIQLIDQHKELKNIYSNQKVPNLVKLIRLEQQKLGYHLINKLLLANLEKLLLTDHKGTHLRKEHDYNTRFKTEPNLPSTKSLSYHNSFLHQSIKESSTLPVHIKNKLTLKQFGKAIKTLDLHILSYTIIKHQLLTNYNHY